MALDDAPVVSFVATDDAQSARAFYGDVLGLPLRHEEAGAALVYSMGDRGTLRVTILPEHTPPPYSVLGWVVADIAAEADSLAERGVTLQRYEGVAQDDRGIATFPNGDRVAWFLDPAGNVLSITQPG